MENRRFVILFFTFISITSLVNSFITLLVDQSLGLQALASGAITVALGLFLVGGKSWARWILVLKFARELIYSLSDFVELIQLRYPIDSLAGIWMLTMIATSAVSFGILALSRRISMHFAFAPARRRP